MGSVDATFGSSTALPLCSGAFGLFLSQDSDATARLSDFPYHSIKINVLFQWETQKRQAFLPPGRNTEIPSNQLVLSTVHKERETDSLSRTRTKTLVTNPDDLRLRMSVCQTGQIRSPMGRYSTRSVPGRGFRTLVAAVEGAGFNDSGKGNPSPNRRGKFTFTNHVVVVRAGWRTTATSQKTEPPWASTRSVACGGKLAPLVDAEVALVTAITGVNAGVARRTTGGRGAPSRRRRGG